ncbi:MAG: riboflavin biosynthesis protein RibF, partial [Deltaproteobacteria bacterium]|nr:riboflavin biosynthesis protein RibF [Deltaproteobacteria bacterium]
IFLITAPQRKAELIAACGIERLVIAPFDREFAGLPAAVFYREVLLEHLGAAVVVVGENYAFGCNREGNPEKLQQLGRADGLEVITAPAFRINGELVSSTAVRAAIMAGDIARAAAFLGRPCTISGRVVAGKSRGRELGFPTANLVSEVELYPKEGVYAVWVDHGGQRYPGLVNIGHNPTFADTGLTVEAHLLDFAGDLYGSELKITFLERFRGEQACSGVEELQALIAADIQRARQLPAFVQIGRPAAADGLLPLQSGSSCGN